MEAKNRIVCQDCGKAFDKTFNPKPFYDTKKDRWARLCPFCYSEFTVGRFHLPTPRDRPHMSKKDRLRARKEASHG